MNKDENELTVSIWCLTYNHAAYIRQCLDGFVMQKTNFRFEAIVHDDASNDDTAIIIREYAEKYPDIIKPIYEKENQYSKHDGSLRRIMNAHTHGKYIALCEGDDYWTDPYKLQRQVDFLESHPDYALCLHRYKFLEQETQKFKETIYPENVGEDGFSFDLNYYITGVWLTQPLTALYRASSLLNMPAYKYFKDVSLFYVILKSGKAHIFPNVSGVYRLHAGGVFSNLTHKKKIIGNIETVKSLCEIEKTQISANFLKNVLEYNLQFVGLRFIIENFILLKECTSLLKTYLKGFKAYSFWWQNTHIMSSMKHLIGRFAVFVGYSGSR